MAAPPPDCAADILEVHLDTGRTTRRQLGGEIGRTVIDLGVEAQSSFAKAHFSGPPAMPTARAGELCELADQRADRSTRCCDNHCLAGLRFADNAQTAIAADPGMPSTRARS